MSRPSADGINQLGNAFDGHTRVSLPEKTDGLFICESGSYMPFILWKLADLVSLSWRELKRAGYVIGLMLSTVGRPISLDNKGEKNIIRSIDSHSQFLKMTMHPLFQYTQPHRMVALAHPRRRLCPAHFRIE